jgi:hypothetical protein
MADHLSNHDRHLRRSKTSHGRSQEVGLRELGISLEQLEGLRPQEISDLAVRAQRIGLSLGGAGRSELPQRGIAMPQPGIAVSCQSHDRTTPPVRSDPELEIEPHGAQPAVQAVPGSALSESGEFRTNERAISRQLDRRQLGRRQLGRRQLGPRQLGRVQLIVRDATTLHVSWSVTDGYVGTARQAGGELVALRLLRDSRSSSQSAQPAQWVEVTRQVSVPLSGGLYLTVGSLAGDYVAELGLTGAQVGWLPLLRSTPTRMPRRFRRLSAPQAIQGRESLPLFTAEENNDQLNPLEERAPALPGALAARARAQFDAANKPTSGGPIIRVSSRAPLADSGAFSVLSSPLGNERRLPSSPVAWAAHQRCEVPELSEGGTR